MDKKNARLYIGRHAHTPLLHLSEEVLGVLKPLFVPGEHAALDALLRLDGAVARGELEAVYRDSLLLGGVDEFRDGVIAVSLKLRIIHGRTQIAQGIFGKKRGFARKAGVALHYLPHGGAGD